jgi:hypothetical protein
MDSDRHAEGSSILEIQQPIDYTEPEPIYRSMLEGGRRRIRRPVSP